MLHDHSLMPFGRYKGKKLIDVPGMYLLIIYNLGCDHVELKQYILDNIHALKNEVKHIRR